MRTIAFGLVTVVFAIVWTQTASAQSLNGTIIVDPTCEMAPNLCRPYAGPGPAGGAGSKAAGPISNDAYQRMRKIWR